MKTDRSCWVEAVYGILALGITIVICDLVMLW